MTTATDYGNCDKCGARRNAGDVIDPDDGLCCTCYCDQWRLYLAEVATRGDVQPEGKRE